MDSTGDDFQNLKYLRHILMSMLGLHFTCLRFPDISRLLSADPAGLEPGLPPSAQPAGSPGLRPPGHDRDGRGGRGHDGGGRGGHRHGHDGRRYGRCDGSRHDHVLLVAGYRTGAAQGNVARYTSIYAVSIVLKIYHCS